MSDDIKFTCSECGQEFEPQPDTMFELEFGPVALTEEEAEALDETGQAISREDLEQASDEELLEWGITGQERDAMLDGESVATGGICVCLDCQDRLSGES